MLEESNVSASKFCPESKVSATYNLKLEAQSPPNDGSHLRSKKFCIPAGHSLGCHHLANLRCHFRFTFVNRLTPNDPYMGRTAPLTSKRCILYIYSTNIGTGYFKYALYCPFYFFSSKCSLFHNVNLFGSCIIHILYIECAEIKKNNSGAKGLNKLQATLRERKMALMKLFAKTNLKARHRIGIILLVQIVT